MHELGHFARIVMENPIALGVMGFSLIFFPIIGMWAVHHYKWEHWEPFAKNNHK